jgi:DNA polymerase I
MLVTSQDQLPQIHREMVQSEIVALDTETSMTNLLSERTFLGLAVTTNKDTYYIPTGHTSFLGSEPINITIPNSFFDGVRCPIVAHNMKFDYQVITKAGIQMPVDNLWCTMMLSVYIDENNKGKDAGHDLDLILRKYLKAERKKTREAAALKQFGWTNAPPEYMAVYAEQDCKPLPELFRTLRPKLSAEQNQLWEETDRDFMLLLSDLEVLGLPIDRQLCEQLNQKCLERMNQIRSELGFDPAKSSQLHPKLFSQPPFGLGLKPAFRTPTGKPQVSYNWLAQQGHPVTSLIAEYRLTAKQQSSYFSAYLKLTTRDYPRLHCTFKQHGTETGRLSCEAPNLQQIPREEYNDAKVKDVFLPEVGRQLWEIDFRTIEYRLQAVYAEDRKLLELFENEGDFHQLVADDISQKLGVNFPRQKAKTVNYLMSFGGGKQVLAKALGVSVGVAASIHAAYRNSYPRIFDKSYEAQKYAEATMEIPIWSGRVRHFKYQSECHKAFNAVIQGGAFEIVKRSMLKLRQAGFVMSNQVHDSVWLNVDNEADVIEAQKLMEDWTKPYFGLSFRTDRKRLK